MRSATKSAGKRWPTGFPRGELLSINQAGDRNASFDPVKVLAWMQKSTQAARTIYGDFTPALVELNLKPMQNHQTSGQAAHKA